MFLTRIHSCLLVIYHLVIETAWIDFCVGRLHLWIKCKDLIRQELQYTVNPFRLGVEEIDELCTTIDGISGSKDIIERV